MNDRVLRALRDKKDVEATVASVRKEVEELCRRFPIYPADAMKN